MKKVFKKGETLPLIGNESIVVGALEAGVQSVFTYPGTPASEIGNLFYKIKENYGIYMEYSTNEIVALESGAGAAFSGLKTLVAMKHFGANVALDALIPLAHTKPRGGMVIVIADDPSCHSSAQSEQDSRILWQNLYLPILEPSTPSEAKEFTKIAFTLSETFQKPVIIRTTTRVSHQGGLVKIGKIKIQKKKGVFKKEKERFDTMPPFVLKQKANLISLKEKIEKYLEKTNLNKVFPGKIKEIGAITSGVSHLYLLESLKKFNISLPILKIDSFYPLPSKKIINFLRGKKKIVVAEEIIDLIEREVKILSKEVNPQVKIFGKEIIGSVGEMNVERTSLLLTKALGLKYQKIPERKVKLPVKRTPRFCPGCPYWAIFNALAKEIKKEKVVFTGDIGCYMIGYFPPFEMQDTLLCMGSSLGLAHGIDKSTKQKVIAFIGDSTFFHAGLPGIINIVNNQSNPLIIIFDNQITAMTGRQPHPGTPLKYKTHDGKKEIKIEKILTALGIENLTILDPIKENQLLREKIKEFLKEDKLKVIICRHPCRYVNALEKAKLRY